jgi:radical SAM protein with 4Fe4S-binding SPASM domain
MNDKFIKSVIEENLVDIINISIDAYTPETYKKIRGGNFNMLIGNVKNLIDHRNSVDSPLKIQVNCIDQPESRAELDEFRKGWERQVDNVMIRTYYDATAVTGETGSNITGKQRAFEKVKRWPCQQLWRRFNIADDGTVRFCVDDWFNKTKLGDLTNETIAQIWTGEEYNRLRHFHIMSQYGKIPYCSKCTEWQGMEWNYDYFTAMKKMLNKDLL